MELTPRWRALLWLLAYFVPRYALEGWMDSLHPYASYTFEVFFIAAVFFAYNTKLRLAVRPRPVLLFEAAVALLCGGLARVGCRLFHIDFPLDLGGTEVLVLLLFVAPFLEEALYRQGLLLLWEELLPRRRGAVIALSALVFSASHLVGLVGLPAEFHSFIYYQAAYALVLGLWLAQAYYRYGGLAATVALHGAFNLGFYLADRY